MNIVAVSGQDGGGSGNSRWNPTKEQITMLEGLYKQGIRTPSADQIQQITARLKAYGHIEGKNVFYWFQNHKARQRQKQKQENMAYFNRYLHTTRTTPPLSFHHPPLAPNVVCGSYFIPQGDLDFYHPQYPNVMIPGSGCFKRKVAASTEHKAEKIRSHGVTHGASIHGGNIDRGSHDETLALFPLHPTGRTATGNSSTMSLCDGNGGVRDASVDHPTFIDFFSSQGS